ncbi:ESAT-6 protein secretion system EspG family protein [Nocardia tenerifensis]|uniref:ESAT-6 protein secretion system EspG family protein n=1 Tax=Nocardia tenerifensis TaxID=228006 RepID=A0A318KCW3_9NOCA|nr:ESX secretion-associated protein EspG [Nocardia tenerifensis]PXX68899.1 ESAT-6 protein secretion system EspG family protein [Nocardia tenerifensis]
MNWTLTPDQFALAWARTDGDRIPYPLAVRLSARDTDERDAQLPELQSWCDRVLDADLEAALRVLGAPELRIEVFGERDGASGSASVRPVRVLGAAAGNVAVVAAQRPGATADRGGDIRLFVGSVKNLTARVISMLPERAPGTTPRLTAPLARVGEDSRDLVTVPVAGPTVATRIRRLLRRPRDGIGQIVVSARRGAGEPQPFGVLCWIDVVDDGRYSVRTGTDVDIVPVTAHGFIAQLRPMVAAAAERAGAYADRW